MPAAIMYGRRRPSCCALTFGVVTFHKCESLDHCIARADAALYRGKEQGRNQVIVGSYENISLVI